MKTKLASVLGLAVLMACFICGSSFVYADDVLEVASSAMQTLAPGANSVESVDKLPCDTSCVGTEHCTGGAQTVEADQSSSAVSEIEPSVTEAPAVQSADAIIVEVTQSVTIVVPGEDAAENEEPAVAGSIVEPAATEEASVVEAEVTEASPAPAIEATEANEANEAADAIVAEVIQTVTIAAPGQDQGDIEAAAAEATTEPSTTEPALTLDAELP
jgi:hypothetical protein